MIIDVSNKESEVKSKLMRRLTNERILVRELSTKL